MSLVDIIIIMMILIFIIKGFGSGVLKETVSFVGGFAVIVFAYLVKNPLSVLLYEHLPFFKFGGSLAGISVLNIIVYETLSFLIIASIFLICYQILLKVTNLLEKIIKMTIVLAFPSKLLGAIVGFLEGVVVTFIVLFVCMQISGTRNYLVESKYASKILTETPLLSKAVEPVYKAGEEIYSLAEEYKDNSDKNSLNKEALNVLLKYEIINKENAQNLVDAGKLKIEGANEVIDKY